MFSFNAAVVPREIAQDVIQPPVTTPEFLLCADSCLTLAYQELGRCAASLTKPSRSIQKNSSLVSPLRCNYFSASLQQPLEFPVEFGDVDAAVDHLALFVYQDHRGQRQNAHLVRGPTVEPAFFVDVLPLHSV